MVDGNINNLEAVDRGGEARRTSASPPAPSTSPWRCRRGAVITKKIIVAGRACARRSSRCRSRARRTSTSRSRSRKSTWISRSLGPSPTNPEEQEVLIAATRKEKVEDRVAVAESAGLKALVMDVESFAQQTALALVVQSLPGGGKDQNVAVVDVGANVMNVTVLRNDQSVYTREQAFGGNQLTAGHRQPLRHEPGGGGERQALRRPARRLRGRGAAAVHGEPVAWKCSARCSSSSPRPSTTAVDHILLAGGSAVIPGLDEVVHTRTQVPTSVANPFALDADLAAHPAQAPDDRRALADRRLRPGDAEVRPRMSARINLLPHREERRKRARQHFVVVAGGPRSSALLIVVGDATSSTPRRSRSRPTATRFLEERDREARQGDRRDQRS